MNLYSFRELVNSTRLGGLQAPTSCCSARGSKSARDREWISKSPVEKRLTHAHCDAPPEVHQLSIATCQLEPAVGRDKLFLSLFRHCQRGVW